MNRAVTAWFLCVAMIFAMLSGAYATEPQNVLKNGGFEDATAGEPDAWYAKAYRSQAGYSRIAVTDEQAHSGRYSAVIANVSSNDARYVCTVDVEPESLYRLSGYVLVEAMDDIGNGANFAIEDIYSFSDGLFDTNGEWQYLEWYGETGEEQTSLSFGIRVGGYSAESIGKAYFDDIKLEKVDELPDDVIASLWYQPSSYIPSAPSAQEDPQKSTGLFIALGTAFLLILFFIQPLLERSGEKRYTLMLAVFMLVALVVRIVLALSVPGYQIDISCFSAWSARMADIGPVGFYAPDYFCDYPPGAMLLLWPTGILLQWIGSANLLVIKSLPIFCDLLGGLCLYWLAQKHIGKRSALALCALYLFNPAVLVNGAAWGQVDSVLALCMLLTMMWAAQRKWHVAIPLFVVSVLIKPQALLFAPIGGMWLLFGLRKIDKKLFQVEIKRVLWGVLFSAVAALTIVIPFSIGQEKPFTWLFDLYGQTLSSYAYATLNTANLYYLVGANWRGLEQLVPHLMMGCTVAFFGLLSALLYVERTRKLLRCAPQKAVKLSFAMLVVAGGFAVIWFIGATYQLYGYLMMAAVYLFVILCQESDSTYHTLSFYMAIALIGVYVLGVKVHERYLFPALLLLLASYVQTRDRRVLWLFAGFSVTTFINTAIVLDNAILFGSAQGHLNDDTLFVNTLLCIANLALCGYGLWLGMSGLRQSETLQTEIEENTSICEGYLRLLLQPSDVRLHLTLRDYTVMGITAVLYAVLAFSDLGSTVAPQTAWVSTSADEQVVVDLGEETEFSVLYYAGVSYQNFSIEVSSDGQTWSGAYPCQMREGMCYQWHYAVNSTEDSLGNPQFSSENPQNILWLNGRYLRINACEAGLNLWEIIARNRDGENLPIAFVSQSNSHPELLDAPHPATHLIDENHTCIGEPSWFNSMYFDEIYHAREAYHNLHGETTYEWTHPPLGKLLMAVGVAIFGMTPFGWRFAGTFMGVLMLPALYLLALQLTKKRTVATVSMLAFALDLMHFTQTRIATIDSFPLLFILLSYLCMVRYMQTDLLALRKGEQPRLLTYAFWRSLVPLCLSGLFMGLGIASKWTGAYSAVGLAVLFFLSVIRQECAAEASYDLELSRIELSVDEQRRLANAQQFTLKRIVVTCAFCVLFFVVVPVVIYVLSYIPQLIPNGPFTIERVIQTQQNMLSYHATPGLGMDHPFQSPWWQWPFLLKPMWYVQDQFEPAGYASTILCFGNPWVFYIGALAMIGVLAACIGKYVMVRGGRLKLRKGNGDLTLLTIVIGFLAQYLPWMLVPRSMYMYHYFASVPFIILATAWFLGKLPKDKPIVRYGIIGAYILGAAVLFIAFFPYASGYITSTQWLDSVKGFFRLYY